MMKASKLLQRQFTVARVYGIPVCIDARWFFVFSLSVWLIATNLQIGALRLITPTIIHGEIRILSLHLASVGLPLAWFLALIVTVLLFLSVFGHELSHALVARAEGIEIEEIVLHPFGGLARMKREPDSPGAEFRIAIAGPASSFLFSMLALGSMSVAAIFMQRAAIAVFFLLFSGNLLLAVFNLLPGYPLDGGRVLRALLWRTSGNIREATRIASLAGQLIAWMLILLGGYMIVAWRGAYLMGIWAILIGLFLRSAAASVMKREPKLITVADAMGLPVSIEPQLLISHFVDTILPLYRQTSFPVAVSGKLHGILSLEDIKSVPRDKWSRLRAADLMRPVEPRFFVEPSSTIARASEMMKQNGIGSLAVIDSSGTLVGFLQAGKIKQRTSN
jgi:Zn-dependent protease